MWIPALAISTPAAGAVVAAAASQGSDPVTILLNAGVIGAFLVLFLVGAIVPRRILDMWITENNRKAETIKELNEQLRAAQQSIAKDAIPALTLSTVVLERLTPLLETETRVRRPGRSP